MKSLIVYDSFFGNTEQIAQSMAQALGEQTKNVITCRVGEVSADHLVGLKILVVGSPTRAFRPTKDIVKFLDELSSDSLKDIKVLAFDTRISTTDANSRLLNVLVKLFGYAAEPIGKRLEKKAGSLVLPPEGFYVKDTEGPLKDGEYERAAKWILQAIR